MKIVRYATEDTSRFGVLAGGMVYSIPSELASPDRNFLSLKGIEALRLQGEEVLEPAVPLASLSLEAPLDRPEKIICIGLNYRRHAAELKMQVPTTPVVFAKYANSLSGHGAEIMLTGVDEKIDYEAELAVVIGKTGKDIPVSEAADYVLGYACANDLSARTLQMATGQWTIGKTLDGFLPLGPCLVTADEVPDPQQLTIRCLVNGDVRQASNTADMIFPVYELISYVSRFMTLRAGDVILTGTPEGVAMGSGGGAWLKPGDRVSVEIESLGELHTKVM
ncbi:fumarylacetoacetate hydrolase family protein (plasmid) [Aminobacter sp. SR38]|jgi:2-keto-4-pentenoate hydratase/2-oxohepta-3-ene-1,7-dioic acid hydratase in catechol pathway|uniref:fumarylacetoacetate hydrolase family protein n=1 Tax=Aminobacter sp. SR38 TaxID=2774562 RepID=UPI001782EF2B|nr:fumarylacetoacetate hydrolase family protein [Aminobacter sp. SR38]QOF75509.1 fumarylacetoacetate hydrolase family protein [Aminobacter sp. SR38]